MPRATAQKSPTARRAGSEAAGQTRRGLARGISAQHWQAAARDKTSAENDGPRLHPVASPTQGCPITPCQNERWLLNNRPGRASLAQPPRGSSTNSCELPRIVIAVVTSRDPASARCLKSATADPAVADRPALPCVTELRYRWRILCIQSRGASPTTRSTKTDIR